MGLFSKDENKGWGSRDDKCVITGAKADTTARTIFGGRVKVSTAVVGSKAAKKGKRA